MDHEQKLELVQISGPNTKCPLQHVGAIYRILRPNVFRIPIMNWYRCLEGHGHEDWPETVIKAKQLAGQLHPKKATKRLALSSWSIPKIKIISILDSE